MQDAARKLMGSAARSVPSGDEVPAPNPGSSAMVGSRGAQLSVQEGTNIASKIGDRLYSGHALDQMQGRGIYPSVVENTIRVSNPVYQASRGTSQYYDTVNDISVILNNKGNVVTTFYGNGK